MHHVPFVSCSCPPLLFCTGWWRQRSPHAYRQKKSHEFQYDLSLVCRVAMNQTHDGFRTTYESDSNLFWKAKNKIWVISACQCERSHHTSACFLSHSSSMPYYFYSTTHIHTLAFLVIYLCFCNSFYSHSDTFKINVILLHVCCALAINAKFTDSTLCIALRSGLLLRMLALPKLFWNYSLKRYIMPNYHSTVSKNVVLVQVSWLVCVA